MKRIIALCSVATILLAGCGIYKPYSRPEVEVEGLYGESTGRNDTTSIADLSWDELFTDPLLQKLIRQGLDYNADLGIARLRIKEAEAALLSSRLAYLPGISLSSQGEVSRFNGERIFKTYSLATPAEWEIDIFGRLTNSKRRAKVALEQSHAYKQAVQTNLIATIANSYYHLLMLDGQLEISRRTADTWTETSRTLQLQKNVGETNEAAVAQAKANKLAVDASILTLQKHVRSLENSLSALLGMTPQCIERSTLQEQVFPDQLTVGIPLLLLNRRPDIRQAEFMLMQAFYTTNVARSAFYPRITLSGTLGWTNQSGAGIINPGNWLLNAIGSLTQPLFNRGANVANLRIAKAQQEEAVLAFRQSLLNAGNEVSDALAQWQTADSRLAIDRKQIVLLQTTVNSSRQLMEYSSSVTYLEVLTAQQSLLEAELTEMDDCFEKIQGVVNLYHALGGGRND